MRRTALLLALTALLSAACGSTTPTSSATSAPASAVPPASRPVDSTPSASLASDDTVWLCKPGLADNPCESDLDATSIDATGAQTVQRAQTATDPPIDCFYVYPTVSRQTTTNANLTIEEEERGVAIAQAARFSQVCNVYAPMYRQLTLAGIARPSRISTAAALLAYNDIYAAFRSYLAHYNRGRGIVFIGHSQGAMMLTALLRNEVDSKPDARRLLVSALLLGGNVTVPVGKSVGGDFASIPACSSSVQTGCVVAYSTFSSTPPADAVFGRVGTGIGIFPTNSTEPLQVLCVNPAAPGGSGMAGLAPYYPVAGLSTFLGSSAAALGVSTPWVTFPNQYGAGCMTSGGATWLQIAHVAGVPDVRPRVSALDGPTWGLHLVDVNIALGNLVELVRSESVAFG